MSAATAWVLAAALWAGCLLPGPWWLAPVGLGLVLAARVAAGSGVAAGPGQHTGPGEHPRDPGSPGPAPASSPDAAVAGHSDRTRRWVGVAMAALALAVAGAGLAGGRVALRDSGPLSTLAATGGAAELHATVVTEARPSGDGAWVLVRVTRLDGHRTRERALLRVDDRADAPALGERLVLTATARPLPAEGFGAHLRRLHAATAVQPGAWDRAGPPGRVLAATNHVRARTRAAFGRHLGAEHAGLLAGLTVGDTHSRSPERAEQFAAASLTHLVVVSGRHVALMLAGVLGLAAALGAGARGRRLLGLGAVAWYALLVRWQPSVLRAGVMAGLVLGAGLLGRRRDPPHVLAMAVLLLLLVDPMLAGQLGFVLSVLATAGVLVVAPWLADRLPGPRPLRLAAAVTLGAQAGAAPVLLAWLDGVPVASVPANLVAVPAAGLAQVVGMAAAVTAQASTTAGAAIAVLAAPALAVVLWSAETFAAGPVVRPEHLATPAAVLLALAGVAAARRRVALAAAVLVVALAAGAWPVLRPPARVDTLTVTALDVGQGDALLVEVPGEVPGDPPARMLYDGGPEPGAALAHLRRRGIRRLDAAVASHPHHDHVAGLPAVLSTLAVGAFLVGPIPPEAHGEHLAPSSLEGYEAARAAGVPVVPVHAGRRFALGAADVAVLSPPADGSLGTGHNDNSVVLRVTTGSGRLLLTGDAEEGAQRRLMRDPQQLRADVVQVPHHGADTNAEGFLDAVGAHTAVISVGADNDYGHPHPAVLADLAGTRVLRTDLDGTVTVEVGTHPALPGGAHPPRGDGDHGHLARIARHLPHGVPRGLDRSRPGGDGRACRSTLPTWLGARSSRTASPMTPRRCGRGGGTGHRHGAGRAASPGNRVPGNRVD